MRRSSSSGGKRGGGRNGNLTSRLRRIKARNGLFFRPKYNDNASSDSTTEHGNDSSCPMCCCCCYHETSSTTTDNHEHHHRNQQQHGGVVQCIVRCTQHLIIVCVLVSIIAMVSVQMVRDEILHGAMNVNSEIVAPPPRFDVYEVRRQAEAAKNSDNNELPCNMDRGIEGNHGRIILDQMRGGLVKSRAYIQNTMVANAHHNTTTTTTTTVVPKILCIVYTSEGLESKRRLRTILNTWASQCDGFLGVAVSRSFLNDAMGLEPGIMYIPYNGPQTTENRWQMVEAIWEYVYLQYATEFDYFHMSGDDAYVIPDNMRAYLMSGQITHNYLRDGFIDLFSHHTSTKLGWTDVIESQAKSHPRPLLLGMPLVHIKSGALGPTPLRVGNKQQVLYPGDGPGYTMNTAALEIVINELSILSSSSSANSDGSSSRSIHNIIDKRESVVLADILRPRGVVVTDTRDSTGKWLYVMEHLNNQFVNQNNNPLRFFGSGMELYHISPQTIAIHVEKDMHHGATYNKLDPTIESTSSDLILRYHELLEGHCL